jgi:hypothetical protein
MIIPERKVPTFCTATRAPVLPAGAAVVALTGSSPDVGRMDEDVLGAHSIGVQLRHMRGRDVTSLTYGR